MAREETAKVAANIGVVSVLYATRAMSTERVSAMRREKQFANMLRALRALSVALVREFGTLELDTSDLADSRMEKRLRAAARTACANATERQLRLQMTDKVHSMRPQLETLARQLGGIDTWLQLAVTPNIVTRAPCIANVLSHVRAATRTVAALQSSGAAQVTAAASAPAQRAREQCV